MNTIYVLMVTAMILIVFSLISRQLLIASLRKKGVYPKKGDETIESAKKLIQSGYPYLAAYCWRSVTGGSLREALDFIETSRQRTLKK